MSYHPEPQDNHLLAALSPAVQQRLFSHLEMVKLDLCTLLYKSSGPVCYIYFPTDSVISLQYLLEDGASTAVSVVGREGLVGINWFLADRSASTRALVQHAGFAYRLPKQKVIDEFNRHGEFMLLTLRYIQALITQVSQTAVCNRHHSVAEQLCRWLLISLDRVSDDRLTMTQEFISNMLGVRREGITEAACNLQKLDVIAYARGNIRVLDRPKLESLACECYQAVRSETDMLLNYLPQRQVVDADSIPTIKLEQDTNRILSAGLSTRANKVLQPFAFKG